jgi:2-polyprenyl-6-methoxyphenol hydroxylase-like FAD-dependent oxidoreductase
MDLRAQHVAVIGGSLGGLAAANVLVQLGATVVVYEQFEHGFAERGSGINISMSLYQDIRQSSEMMRLVDVAALVPNAKKPMDDLFGAIPTMKQAFYGDAWQYLAEELPRDTVQYASQIEELVDAKTNKPKLVVDGTTQAFDLIVLADGGWSALRRHVTTTQPKYAGYVLWRCLVELEECPGFNGWGYFKHGLIGSMCYPVRRPDGGVFVNGGLYVAQPEEEVAQPQTRTRVHGFANRATPPDWFLPLVAKVFGGDAGGDVVRMYRESVRVGKVVAHPIWEFQATQMVKNRVLLLGDCAHMATPNTARGGHTALLDAQALRSSLRRMASGDTLDEALAHYNAGAVKRADALLEMGCARNRRYLPEGGMGAVTPPGALLRARGRL